VKKVYARPPRSVAIGKPPNNPLLFFFALVGAGDFLFAAAGRFVFFLLAASFFSLKVVGFAAMFAGAAAFFAGALVAFFAGAATVFFAAGAALTTFAVFFGADATFAACFAGDVADAAAFLDSAGAAAGAPCFFSLNVVDFIFGAAVGAATFTAGAFLNVGLYVNAAGFDDFFTTVLVEDVETFFVFVFFAEVVAVAFAAGVVAVDFFFAAAVAGEAGEDFFFGAPTDRFFVATVL
jgi:hypothetical protein